MFFNSDVIKDNLATLKKSIIKIRESNLSDAKKLEQISVLFDVPKSPGKTRQMEFLASSDVETFSKMFERTEETLDTVLNLKITVKDFERDNIDEKIEKGMSKSIPRGQAKMITTILNQIIVPNMIVNELERQSFC